MRWVPIQPSAIETVTLRRVTMEKAQCGMMVVTQWKGCHENDETARTRSTDATLITQQFRDNLTTSTSDQEPAKTDEPATTGSGERAGTSREVLQVRTQVAVPWNPASQTQSSSCAQHSCREALMSQECADTVDLVIGKAEQLIACPGSGSIDSKPPRSSFPSWSSIVQCDLCPSSWCERLKLYRAQ